MNVRRAIVWILCALLVLGLFGCGSKAYPSLDQVIEENDYISKDEVTTDTESTTSLPENRKLIQIVNMAVETEDLDAVLAQLDSRVAELGGYIESSRVQNGSAYSGRRYRYANLTIRIPAKDLNSFIDKVSVISNIVSSEKTVDDVTLTYVATESRMKALQTEETRLLELLSKAETLDDLLTVEKRLTEVRTELESVTSALRVLDNEVDYATIHLDVDEVKEFTEVTEPETVWQRIGYGFKESLEGVGTFLEDLFVFVIVSIPYIAVIAVIPVIVLVILWRSKRKKKQNLAKQTKKDET